MSKFDCIIGYTSEKRELAQIADVLKNNAVYEKLGVSSPRGLLLYGEPGVGKSLMASALIEESGRNVYNCRKDQPNGDFIKTIKATFVNAAENAPSIVFLDDMDKFANGDAIRRDAEEYVTVQSCIDEVKGSEVFVLATVNSICNLPNSLIRAGRFDRVIEIEAPRGADAEKIVSHYLAGKKFVNGIDAKTVARIMDGCSCAELETVINEAGLYAGYNRASEITMEHFMRACMRMVFEIPDYSQNVEGVYADLTDNKNILAQIVYHEAGHAVLSEILSPQSVTLISAIVNSKSKKGFTSYHNDLSLDPLRWKQSRIISSLGGMAAIEQKYGVVGWGNGNDLDQAFYITSDLVINNCVCGFSLHGCTIDQDTPELRAKQEQAVASEVERYYRKAKEILAANTEFFEKMAKALAQRGLLTMGEVQKIKSTCKIIYFEP